MNLKEFKTTFDTHYLAFLDIKIATLSEITSQSENHDLVKYAREMAVSGKRIRPYLCYLSYISCDGESFEEIAEVCIALELIHTFALFHDDVMDESTLRRGKTTIHHKYLDLTETAASARSGESMAILIGDLYYTWAFELLLGSEFLKTSSEARKTILSLLSEVIHGQIIDVVVSDSVSVSTSELKEKNRLKTSSYTFIRPMELGCLLAGQADCEEIMKAGVHLGEAFQVIDDVIDIVGNSKLTEKDICLDVETAQHTLISNYIADNAPQELQDEFFSFFGKKLSLEDKSRVQQLAVESGAIEESRKHASTEIKLALEIIDSLEINKEIFAHWHTLGSLLEKRMS